MSRRQWLSPLVVLVAPAPVLGAEVFLKEADAPQTMFASGVSSVRKTVELTAAELEKLSLAIGRKVELSKYSYFEVRVGAELLGRIFLLDVVGQSQPISFAGCGSAKRRGGKGCAAQCEVERCAFGSGLEAAFS